MSSYSKEPPETESNDVEYPYTLRILFLIRSLEYGGAQKQLVTLALGLREAGYTGVSVAVFYGDEPFEVLLRECGIDVHVLDKRHRWDIYGFLTRLVKLIRQQKPDVVYGFLDTPNILIAGLRPFLRSARIVWGVRSAFVDWDRYDWLARITHRAACALARYTDMIIVNSNSGVDHHVSQGYPVEKMCFIPNGIDTDMFYPNLRARIVQRGEWKLEESQFVVGIVARLDPMKDYETFITAAAIFSDQHPDARFICLGSGSETYTRHLHTMADESGLTPNIIWIPESRNISNIYNALDVFTLCSYGEAFPNAVGEAMACGVPCVVTDAGDSAWLVDGAGVVVPKKDPEALARVWSSFHERSKEDLRQMGRAARSRIERDFTKDKMISRTQAALNTLVGKTRNER
jgi:glycosyltransferase involved in cell wall biosynthesis